MFDSMTHLTDRQSLFRFVVLDESSLNGKKVRDVIDQVHSTAPVCRAEVMGSLLKLDLGQERTIVRTVKHGGQISCQK